MLIPKRTKYRKPHKVKYNKRKAFKGNTVAFGTWGLQAKSANYITNKQIEAARVAMTRYMKRGGKVWIRIFPHLSLTAKPLEVRMGSGKGAPEHWVAVVKENTVMFEIDEVSEETAKEALRLAAHKLAVKTKIIKKVEGKE